MYSAPPVPPPKPGSHEASRMGTPAASQSPRPPPFADQGGLPEAASSVQVARPEQIPDPGDQWLPKMLEDKSKQDLADVLSSPALLSALTHAPGAAHPSLAASHGSLRAALAANVELARHLSAAESRLAGQRADAQARLLSTRALERQWHARQRDVDAALAPFAPDGLYLRLAQACQEQAAVCDALEESFLDQHHGRRGAGDKDVDGGGGGGGGGGPGRGPGGDNDAPATERETLDWVRQYREAKKLLYLRQERKERWDEGRVGGWR